MTTKPFAVYKRQTLIVTDLVNPFIRHSEHATMDAAKQEALALEKAHPSLFVFAGVNDGIRVGGAAHWPTK